MPEDELKFGYKVQMYYLFCFQRIKETGFYKKRSKKGRLKILDTAFYDNICRLKKAYENFYS
jgi:hypothetical protein